MLPVVTLFSEVTVLPTASVLTAASVLFQLIRLSGTSDRYLEVFERFEVVVSSNVHVQPLMQPSFYAHVQEIAV